MSAEFITFLSVLVVAPTALAIWIAIQKDKEN
jgi:hypothetical protein